MPSHLKIVAKSNSVTSHKLRDVEENFATEAKARTEVHSKTSRGNNLYDKIIGKKLRKLRKKHSLSLEELAYETSLTAQELENYEIGINSLSIEKLIEISKILEISPLEFISELESCSNYKKENTYDSTISTSDLRNFKKLQNSEYKIALNSFLRLLVKEIA